MQKGKIACLFVCLFLFVGFNKFLLNKQKVVNENENDDEIDASDEYGKRLIFKNSVLIIGATGWLILLWAH